MNKNIFVRTGLLMAFVAPAWGLTLSPSATLQGLQNEADKQPAFLAGGEQARAEASAGFTGERASAGAVAAPLVSGMPGMQDGPAYSFKAGAKTLGAAAAPQSAPAASTGKKPKPKPSIIPPKLIYGPMGLGAGFLLAGVGLVIAGAGAPGLLLALGVLGGVGLGIGGLLWYINKKLSGV